MFSFSLLTQIIILGIKRNLLITSKLKVFGYKPVTVLFYIIKHIINKHLLV